MKQNYSKQLCLDYNLAISIQSNWGEKSTQKKFCNLN